LPAFVAHIGRKALIDGGRPNIQECTYGQKSIRITNASAGGAADLGDTGVGKHISAADIEFAPGELLSWQCLDVRAKAVGGGCSPSASI
jgi:hypothetical protein